jgi:hypothetical protein
VNVSELLAQVRHAGAELLVVNGKLKATPPGRLPPDLRAVILERAADIKSYLRAEQAAAEIGRVARADGWRPLTPADCPAYSILTICQRAGVALRIDPENGDLVVGKAGAKAEEPSQPWRSLLTEIEAHVEAVAILVEAGWTLRAEFPKEVAV